MDIAYDAKKPAARRGGVKTLRFLGRVIAGLLLAAIMLLNLFTYTLQVVHYNGDAMEPGLQSGQTLLLRKTQNVTEGDVIAFYYNNQVLVRRVIALGGSRITIEDNGAVLVDERELDEPYVRQLSLGQCNIDFPYYVQPGYVFVMGDDRVISMDSRLEELGQVRVNRIIGKVILAF